MTKTQKHRSQFRESWHYLRNEQNEYFEHNSAKILNNITMGGITALKEEAKKLQDMELYSPYSWIGSIESSILKRLWRIHHPKMSWHNFIKKTVGLNWLNTGKDNIIKFEKVS